MYSPLRILAILASLFVACVAWEILGAAMAERTAQQRAKLSGSVAELWGSPLTQAAPAFSFSWATKEDVTKVVDPPSGSNAPKQVVHEHVEVKHTDAVLTDGAHLAADITLDQRRKGLTWYSLYGVHFEGTWTYVHARPESGEVLISFPLPDAGAMYDDLQFVVDGTDLAASVRPEGNQMAAKLSVVPGQKVVFHVNYRTRGQDTWAYSPGDGVAGLRDFHLRVTTDFAAIDYPAGAMSPSTRERTDRGWLLNWDFTQVLTGHSMGVVMPARIQPGELAARLACSAPISLLLFFLMMFVLSVLRRLDIHPINYVGLAAAFFAFHLLFAYTVDHVSVAVAFVIASVTSITLVVTYLRLVVSTRFAFVEAGLAQLVYQVGFSLAHFWEGYTGLTITVLGVLTLFVLMQLTGRIRWSQVLRTPTAVPAVPR